MIKMLNVSKGVLLSLLPGLLCISFVMVPAFFCHILHCN